MKVVIVGGVAGGATAAARIRRLDEHAEITVYERYGYISYANCVFIDFLLYRKTASISRQNRKYWQKVRFSDL